MLGSIAFIVVLMLIAPGTRQFIMDRLNASGEWIQNGYPLSYILMFVMAAAPLFAYLAMATWPVREDLVENSQSKRHPPAADPADDDQVVADGPAELCEGVTE